MLVTQLQFLACLDPRVVVVLIDPSLAAQLGAKVYQLGKEPFKFPDAGCSCERTMGVTVKTPFRIDASNLKLREAR